MTAKTRMIVINSPSNPTGAIHGDDDLRRVVTKCQERGIVWIADEIYQDFVYASAPKSIDDLGGDNAGIRVNGLSKTFSMMGWRLGWLIASPETITRLVPLHQHLVTCAPTPAQRATVQALAIHGDWTKKLREHFDAKRRLMSDLANQIPDVSFATPAGAFYLFLDISRYRDTLGSSIEIAGSILREVDVVTIPGAGFGAGGEGHLRLAYTGEDETLREAMGRLAEFFHGRPRA
jgi:aspartate aminotransferase